MPLDDDAPLTPLELLIADVLADEIVRELLAHPKPVAVDDDEPDDVAS